MQLIKSLTLLNAMSKNASIKIMHSSLGLLFCITSFTSSAQVLIGGEFSYSLNGSINTFNVITYSLYEPNLEGWLNYGDGGAGIIEMSSELINDTVYKNSGSAIHIFGLPGTYLVSFESDNIVDDIRNVAPSDNAKLYMEVIFKTFLDPIINTAPVCAFPLLDFTIDDACYITQSRYAIDAEGDSITYSLRLFSTYGDAATVSTFPEATDSIGINLNTGEFYWRNAIYRDNYGIRYNINKYRDGIFLGTSMQEIITPINCGIVSNINLTPATFAVFPNPVNDNLELT